MNTEFKIEVKNIKHTFTAEERDQLGGDLARALAGLRGIEGEFDQVKASFKARITESESRIDRLSTDRMNGFEMKDARCVVVYHPKNREKDYFLESDAARVPDEAIAASGMRLALGVLGVSPVLTERMTEQDFQQELIQAESKFDNQDFIQLFNPTETDSGTLVVGRFAGKWFSALRVTIGKAKLNERLDSEQMSYSNRADAVNNAISRAKGWLKQNFKDLSKGFDQGLDTIIEANKERAE